MESDTTAALAIIRTWDWEQFDFHGDPYPKWLSLSEAVNALAFDGHNNAPAAILSLLCEGKLAARGSFSWRKHRAGQHFQRDGVGEIQARRWQEMAEIRRLHRLDDEWPPLAIDLPRLNLTEVERFDWAWCYDRMSFAIVLGDEADWGSGPYSEETYSTYQIEVRPGLADVVPLEAVRAPELAAIESNKGGAPRQYDWERAVAAVVFKWADEGSWQPASKADVVKALADWFATQDRHPSGSSLKEHARWLFEEFQRRNGEASNLAA